MLGISMFTDFLTASILLAAVSAPPPPAHGMPPPAVHAPSPGPIPLQRLAPAAFPASDAAPESSDPRPIVLLIHGRGLQTADTAQLRMVWLVALQRGIERVAGEPVIEESDFRLVWYADALSPGPDQSCGMDQPRASRRSGWSRDLTTAMETAGRLMGLAADWIGGPEGAALGALAGDLLYLGDERRRCNAEERLARALAQAAAEGRPVILVSHSFGALVSYHHLRVRNGPEVPIVERWITIGSLLGHPELRHLLLDQPGGGLPPGVGSWVNIHDPRDPLSAPLTGLDRDEAVEDRIVERRVQGDPHDPVRYLGDPVTGRAVLEAWCGARYEPAALFPAPSPACTSLLPKR